MNSNFSYDRRITARGQSRIGSRSAKWVMAVACLLTPLSVGCQFGGHAAVHHPAFDQLEQGCFGYEPTVWRSMPGDCQQAVRMIPEEVVIVPKAPSPTPAKVEMSTPPSDDAAGPEESMLDEVPDGGPLDVPRIVAPPEDSMPSKDDADAESAADAPEDGAATAPPAVSPSAIPNAPASVPPAKKPAAAPPAIVPPPATEPKLPPATEPKLPPATEPAKTEPKTSSIEPKQLPPVILGPIAKASASKAAANALFETISQALVATPEPKVITAARVAEPIAPKKPAAGGLSRFISY